MILGVKNSKNRFRVIQGASKNGRGFKDLPFPIYLTYILLFSMFGDDVLTFDVVEVPVPRRYGFHTRAKKKTKSLNFGTKPNRTSPPPLILSGV